jgi:phosphatidylserine/phosphatidylglycerophosphate/cardiolipin synthase-like enzyme
VAVSRGGTMSAEFSPRWFLDGTEYPRKAATFGLLINGQEAFRAVHEAIAAAKKSVCIICWGFQPSMYFIRDGKSPCIGDLLEANAREGKKIRVLSWSMEIPTPLHRTVGVTGFAGEPNTPGRRDLAISDKLAGMTDQQFEYNKHWFGLYDAQTDHNVKRSFRSLYRGFVNDTSMQNLVFRSRGFTPPDRAIIAIHSYLDKGISNTTRSVLASSTSHHQKMVLIDHESAEDAVGFVMGHNMLDWYWDTSAHSMKGRPYLPNLGPNAPLPREDFSSRVTGPVLNDLYDNFQGAWNRALLEEPGYAVADPLPLRSGIAYKQKPRGKDVAMSAQVVRTQVQEGVRHIQQMYLQAVSNATQQIYIENQYFRWPPLAEHIKQHAKTMAQWGKSPEDHCSLFLFVITNTSDDGMGAGANNTQRMLESLGQGGALPAATRDARIERGELPASQVEQYKQKQAAVDAAQSDIKQLERERRGIDMEASQVAGLPNTSQGLTQRYESVNERIKQAEQRKADAQKSLDEWTTDTISSNELKTPGLKTLICRLVAPDTAAGASWVETYIHAKLMVIDDTFMTLGSANINTRSMASDSELNILHDRPEVSAPARQSLWDIHTGNYGGRRIADLPLEKAYTAWEKIMEKNLGQRKKGLPPIAALDAFLRLDPSRKDWD